VHGRHVVDTYQQIQRYDTAGRLGSYALKRVMRELGLERNIREFIAGELIRDAWMDPEGRARLQKYALDDVRDVDALARLCLPTEFYQTQLVPRPFQNVAIGGPGEKINDMMLRAYLHAGHSIPKAQQPRDYPGGHAELLRIGDFRPVVKCDVESLYPSLMLAERITSKSDVLNASLPMLADLTNRRLHAKAQSRRTTGNEQAMWDGLQSSFKVLINSFYGYLGYGAGFLNDYDAAERVTLAGQDIIKEVVDRLKDTGAIPIEVDTDGVYFVPPSEIQTEADEVAYVQDIGSTLPAGIRLAHDGRYAGMLSLKLKNYALLDHDGRMILKGSSLRSRRMERCFREFLSAAAQTFLNGDRDAVRNLYFELGERIRNRALPIDSFIQWGMLTEQTLRAQPRFKRLEARLAHDTKTGDRIAYYEREDGELALSSEYGNDESIPYLLKRLRDVAERFRPLFQSDSEFDAFFPQLSTRTDMEAARAQEAVAQLGLFG
jgi:DNA polymerase elongation subunit (family B)